MKRTLLPVAAFSLLTGLPAAAQSVIVVDDDGGVGVDFTDLQPAINAAGPLDRIEVRNGAYSPFVASGPVTIVGKDPSPGSANVVQGTITGLLAGEIAVIADMDVQNFTLSDSDGAIVLDGVESQQMEVLRCADARLQSSPSFGFFTRTRSLVIEDSFVQGMDLFIEPLIAGIDEDGFDAITCVRSTLYLTDCDIEGGEGGDQGLCLGGLNPQGGDALALTSSQVRLMGSDLEGGGPGFNCFGSPNGLIGRSISFRDANNTVVETDTVLTYAPTGPGTVQSEPGIPYLVLAGDYAPGATSFFEFYAEGGSSLRAFLGRRPVVTPVSGLAVPLLHSAERGVSLGSTPGNGRRSLPFVVPALPTGTLIHVQSSRTLAGGSTELSNSVTLVVR